MRIHGRLTEWNDSRGFGFITPLSGGSRVFVHITGFPSGDRRPILNELLSYEMSSDERGRPRAVQVLHATPGRSATSKSPRHFSLRQIRRRVSQQLIPILALLLIAVLSWINSSKPMLDSSGPTTTSQQSDPADAVFASAFENHQSGIQVTGRGTVVKVLVDDNDGDRHQRFILALASGQTLLIAHNIDIAPRIISLAQGATVAFSGVYEWNEEGGVVHWTHHDPDGRHAPGWLELNDCRYQ